MKTLFNLFQKRDKKTASSSNKRARLQVENLEGRLLMSTSPWDFQVNTQNYDIQEEAAVASAPDGRTVAVWSEYNTGVTSTSGSGSYGIEQYGNVTDHNVKARVYDKCGDPLTDEIVIADSLKVEHAPKVAMNDSGNFAVVWNRVWSENDTDVVGAVFNANGTKLRIFFATSYVDEIDPDIAMAANGSFVVSFTKSDYSGEQDVLAKMFDAKGNYLRQIDVAATSLNEYNASVATTADGRFSIAYEKEYSGLDKGILLARYDSNGNQLDSWDLRMDGSYRTDVNPDVAMDNAGNAVVVYQVSDYSSGSLDWNLKARRVSANGQVGTEFSIADDGPAWYYGWNTRDETRPEVSMHADNGSFVVAYNRSPSYWWQAGRTEVVEVTANNQVSLATWLEGRADPHISIDKDGYYTVVAKTTPISQLGGDEIVARRGYLNGFVDGRRVLYLNFDVRVSISWNDLQQWSEDWGADAEHLDTAKDGIASPPFGRGKGTASRIINQIIAKVQEDVQPFGITVVRHTGSAIRDQGATTVFIGRSDVSGPSPHVAGDVDINMDSNVRNNTDIAFVDDESWYQMSDGLYTSSVNDSAGNFRPFSEYATVLAAADVILHEAGHTYGLFHVDSGTYAETMGLRYSNPIVDNSADSGDEDAWIRDVSFLNRTFSEFEDEHGVLHGGGRGSQNSYEAMMQAVNTQTNLPSVTGVQRAYVYANSLSAVSVSETSYEQVTDVVESSSRSAIRDFADLERQSGNALDCVFSQPASAPNDLYFPASTMEAYRTHGQNRQSHGVEWLAFSDLSSQDEGGWDVLFADLIDNCEFDHGPF